MKTVLQLIDWLQWRLACLRMDLRLLGKMLKR